MNTEEGCSRTARKGIVQRLTRVRRVKIILIVKDGKKVRYVG